MVRSAMAVSRKGPPFLFYFLLHFFCFFGSLFFALTFLDFPLLCFKNEQAKSLSVRQQPMLRVRMHTVI
ncbi:hypothetical protein DQK32_15540 [Salmonella enterica subsp. enterica serovar Newport]|uniref:Uncharacterized protein n=2 Tax=Salmonella enterica TaxID=28901 RepID=A0A5T2WM55_SALER|nr:hypothetical protein [Salmonella enterica]EBS4547299.1 hypothetical protein [Salmonella enterica subsp. enterica serovar Newport]EBV5863128.1 hypothetical protein [Salmonella enterica subsp. enterica serovar Bere]EBW5501302.1 hypothetical protein [Salmonella enterica subsp. enterica serovar Enteritidis]ECI0840445.1 hypothetical protein [Salmonella enterica subsp. diarizonae]